MKKTGCWQEERKSWNSPKRNKNVSTKADILDIIEIA